MNILRQRALASIIFSKYNNECCSATSFYRRELLRYFVCRANYLANPHDWIGYDRLDLAQCDAIEYRFVHLVSDEEFNAVLKRTYSRNKQENLLAYRQAMKQQHSYVVNQ